MNEAERTELERLKQRHARLENELAMLASQLRVLETRLEEAPAPLDLEVLRSPAPVPPILESPIPKSSSAKPPPLPPIVREFVPEPPPMAQVMEPVPPSPEPKFAPEPEEPIFASQRSEATPPNPPAPPMAKEKASFEMRLGTYWLVRIGLVLVLTGLVFFGNLAYQNMEAGGKVALLYLASGILLGLGWWWQRKPLKESLKNYAQVLFAGGLAGIYSTTYAAHHVRTLQIIESPFIAGILLLAWAGFMAWIADRKKSELLALFAVSLAYYTSVITPVEGFTLYSNLVLTAIAVFFLLRNRWAGLSWASLLATYLSYAYWRFYHVEGWRWASPGEHLWFGASFLWGYWLIFTLAVFLSKHKAMIGERRAAFLTFNNGAMFTLFLLTMIQTHNHKFWVFALGYGSVLLCLAELARRFLPAEPITKNTYLTQGLLLVTVGIISKFLDVPQTLALMLAAESVMLFILGTFRKNIFLQTAAYLTGAMAVAWGVDGLARDDFRGLRLGIAIGAAMLVNAYWSHWRMAWADRRELRPVPAYFTALTLVMWAFTTWHYTSHVNFGLFLVLEGIVLTLSVYALRMPEVPLLGMSFFVLAQTAWGYVVPKFTAREMAVALAINGAVLLGVGRQRKIIALEAGAYVSAALAVLWGINGLEKFGTAGLATGIALGALMAAMACWMHRAAPEDNALVRPRPAYFTLLALMMWVATTWFNTRPENFPLALAVEAAALIAMLYITRVREFAVLGQGLLCLGLITWFGRFAGAVAGPVWWNPLLMIAITLGLSHWWQHQKRLPAGTTASKSMQAIYALALVALACIWLGPHSSPSSWIVVTSALAVGVTAYGVATKTWPLAICGQIFLIISGVQLLKGITSFRPDWEFPLAPIMVLGLLSFATGLWFACRPESDPKVRKPLLLAAMIYRWLALLMSLWWVGEYIRERERVWVYALVGVVVFILAGRRRNREALMFGGVFTLAGMVTLWLMWDKDRFVYLPNFLAVFALLVQQQAARRLNDRYAVPNGAQAAIIVVAGLTLWRLLSSWVTMGGSGYYLTMSWSALAFALLGCGVVLREKMYRWLGLAILAAAFGRIVIFDVWKLQIIYRVLSFMALGVVLIVLGFIYIRYEERIRRWL